MGDSWSRQSVFDTLMSTYDKIQISPLLPSSSLFPSPLLSCPLLILYSGRFFAPPSQSHSLRTSLHFQFLSLHLNPQRLTIFIYSFLRPLVYTSLSFFLFLSSISPQTITIILIALWPKVCRHYTHMIFFVFYTHIIDHWL